MLDIRGLENRLWDVADMLRANSKLTSNQYCMPVLGLLFLRYAYSRYKKVEQDILQNRPSRGGRVWPVTEDDFKAKNALYLPREAQFDYLLETAGKPGLEGRINRAMELIEAGNPQLHGILPKNYETIADNNVLPSLLGTFNDQELDNANDDVIGRIYEYFLNKFAKNIASDDGVFFTPKSLVKMIVNVIEPDRGKVLDPACGSGGMFVASGDFVNAKGNNANENLTFYGQEKVQYNAQLCLMNMAVHGLSGQIKYGDEGNSFYHDSFNLAGKCDYVMANPPFNVDRVDAEKAKSAGRMPFGSLAESESNTKKKEFNKANYLWISYFYAYLNEHGRAGFVMAAAATDGGTQNDKEIRKKLVNTGDVDVLISVGNNFFYKVSLESTLWFFNRNKNDELKNKVLFIDSRKYFTVVDRTLNEWTDWQLKNLTAIVWLYRGQSDKYIKLLDEYKNELITAFAAIPKQTEDLQDIVDNFLNPKREKEKQSKINLKDTAPKFTIENKIEPDTLTDDLNKYLAQVNDVFKQTADAVKAYKKPSAKSGEKTKKKPRKAEFEQAYNKIENSLQYILNTIKEYRWLTEKFGQGKYNDIAGICKIATLDEISEKGYALTPGMYVGVAPVEDDGVIFDVRMKEIHKELLNLQNDANNLMQSISNNLRDMGL